MYEKILIADDEEGMVSFIKDSLVKEGYEVWVAYDGEQAVKNAMRQPDLIILDIMMPGKDGFTVCQAIRDIVSCPIIFVSALQSEADRIKAFVLGGDDYIIKPFSMREMKTRIHAHLRREKRVASLDKRTCLRYGDLIIDIKGHDVYFMDAPLYFTAREFGIIELLALHPGMVFSKEQIYERVWGYDAVGDAAGVAEHIKNIRCKFTGAEPNANFISTIWGVGYKWERTKKG